MGAHLERHEREFGEIEIVGDAEAKLGSRAVRKGDA
jgi:hypothetical protein